MTTVYIVVEQIPWQGDYIMGVFATYDAAAKYIETMKFPSHFTIDEREVREA